MSAPSPVPSRGVSPLVLVLAVLLAGATTAAVLGWTRGSGRTAEAGTGAPAVSPADTEPVAQNGSVIPQGEGSGIVYYPVPYASPPSLTVEPRSRYMIVQQDEFGFTWLDRARQDEAVDLLANIPEVARVLPKDKDKSKFDPKQPELTWQAMGVRGAPGAQPMKLFEQTGTFVSDQGQQGQVNFPVPYAAAPNVELSGHHTKTVITECTATGFKWKNGSKGDWQSEYGSVTWKAKGVRATQLPKA